MKKVLSLLCCGALLAALCTAFAAGEVGRMALRYDHEAVSGSGTYPFRLTETLPSFRLWVKNTGTGPLSVAVQAAGQGRAFFTALLEPGQELDQGSAPGYGEMVLTAYGEGVFSLLTSERDTRGTFPLSDLAEAKLWDGDFWSEGRRAFLADMDRHLKGYGLICRGNIYIPFYTARQWTGMTGSWDPATGEATLHSGGTRVFYGLDDQWPSNDENRQRDAQPMRNSVLTVRTLPGLTVDGAPHTFTDAAGEPAPLLVYNGELFLPVRGVGELAGLEVAWADYDPTSYDRGSYYTQTVYLRTPMTEAQKAEVRTFLDSGYALCRDLDEARRAFIAIDQANQYDKAALTKQLIAMRDTLGRMQALPMPSAPMAAHHYGQWVERAKGGFDCLEQDLAAMEAGTTFRKLETGSDDPLDAGSQLLIGPLYFMQNALEQKGFTDADYRP